MKKYLWIALLLASAAAGAQQRYPTGLLFDPAGYEKVPVKAVVAKGTTLPRKVSYEEYCPPVMNQEDYSTCVAFATTYYLRSILQSITGKPALFSPSYTYEKIKSPDDLACLKGARLADALYLLKKTGALPYDAFPYPNCGMPEGELDPQASPHRIGDVIRLFGEKAPAAYRIATMKKALSEGYPVVIGMETPFSFFITRDVWELAPGEVPSAAPGHALCVVGYDDDRFGGAFRVINSWGSGWADKGYCWVRYKDLARFVREAFQAFPEIVQPVKGSMRLLTADGKRMETTRTDAQTGGFYRASESFGSGTKFKLYVSNSQQVYVYALGTDSTGHINRLLPDRDGVSALLGRNTTVVYPSETRSIVLDQTPGTDYLIVLFSQKELNINEIMTRLQSEKGSVSERLQKVTGPVAARYESDQPVFETDGKQAIVPLVVAIRHL